MKSKCQNCGHDCHCEGYCLQDSGEKEATVCCTYCRHKENDESWKDEVKYDTMDYDSFNGA